MTRSTNSSFAQGVTIAVLLASAMPGSPILAQDAETAAHFGFDGLDVIPVGPNAGGLLADDVDGDGRTRWQSRHDEKKANRRESGVLTLAERLVGEAVYGRNPVLAMLGADRRDVSGIWIQEGSDASSDKALLKAAAARGLTPEYASKHDLNMLTGGGSRPHNGVVADASPLTPTPMD